jgi:Zn ribbon nucleic-acid-binding protein
LLGFLIADPSSALIGDSEFGTHAGFSVRVMPKNIPPPACPKCRKSMQFLLWKTGGRKFQCPDCGSHDQLLSPKVAKLLAGELQPLK